MGPSSSIVLSEREAEKSKDKFIIPQGTWSTNHKAAHSKFSNVAPLINEHIKNVLCLHHYQYKIEAK